MSKDPSTSKGVLFAAYDSIWGSAASALSDPWPEIPVFFEAVFWLNGDCELFCEIDWSSELRVLSLQARMVIIIAFDGAIFSPHKRPTKIQYGCDEVSKVDRVYDLTSSDFAEALERDLTAERFSSNAMDTHGL